MSIRSLFRPSIGYMALTAFCFSVMAMLVRLVGRHLPSQEIVVMRGIVTLLLSLAIVWRARVPMLGERRKLLMLRGLFGFLALSCFYWSVCHLPMAEATVIQYTNPVFTALFAAVVLGERVPAGLAASTALSLAGVVWVARPASLFGGASAALDPVGVAIAVAGALMSAGAYVTVRELSASESPEVIVLYFPLVTLPLSLPALAFDPVWPTAMDWLMLLGVGVSTQIGQMALTRGLALETAASATAIGYLQVVFAIGWGIAIFGEVPDPRTIAGAMMVVVGTLLVAASSLDRAKA